jgi:hypothetical protein
MINNRGTHIVNVPIRFHIGALRINWEIVHENGTTLFVAFWPAQGDPKYIELCEGWELVRRYLKLRVDDEESILKFLVAHGLFQSPTRAPVSMGTSRMVFETFSLQEFATIQDYVRQMVLTGNPTLPAPWHGKVGSQEYNILFTQGRSGSQAVVRVSGILPSILATIQFRLAQGARFRTCARRDCRLPFEITSRHKRRFCTQYCAHITSLRQRRKLESKRRKQNMASTILKSGGSQ